MEKAIMTGGSRATRKKDEPIALLREAMTMLNLRSGAALDSAQKIINRAIRILEEERNGYAQRS